MVWIIIDEVPAGGVAHGHQQRLVEALASWYDPQAKNLETAV